MDDNELEYIKINYSIFKNILLSHNSEIPEILLNKYNDLITNYNCFASNYDARSLWEKKKIMASKKNKTRTRPHLISFDFTDEMKCKKEFTSYLNKLTDLNKTIIYNKIKTFLEKIDEDIINLLIEIVWNFIKISCNNIYIDVLYIFDQKYIIKYITIYWDKYNKNIEWLPPDNILINKNLFKDDNYDEYCDYVKWKKYNISITRAWCNIFKKENMMSNIDIINLKIIEKIEEGEIIDKHIINLLYDQISIFLDSRPNKIIINKIINIDLNTCENSTKFKIINILDKYK